ncbi:hypothetical protein H072_2317 [Dactylellina haptotyla CBS 200.50]|uniref:Phytoene desaturase n=1 Tax=Dactylellina haptotyla (strain CBS 200.50) TaxID=1284197 RepID=S8ARQ7_DACHA|nr:hypothetical protein H072_2317 [Dactylellina haptotyla CBS 200.50]
MERLHDKKSVIIIGAGVGGCASAARLAKAGFKVTVVEKNDFTGGRCSLIHDGEHRFDQGPSLLLLPDLFHETFADLDTTMPAEGVHLLKCDPNYQIFFHDNEKMTLSSDLAHMKPEIEKWEGKDGFERYLGFLAEGHRHYEFSMQKALRRNFPSIMSMLRPDLLKDIVRMFVFTSLYTRASAYFWTDRLRRCFTFGSMYMGMSPYTSPALYSLLQYTELVEGIWYPRGGFHKVVEAIVNIGQRWGVDYQLNSPVQSILLSEDEKQAVGVVLQSGRHLRADIILANADLIYTYNNLLPETAYSKKLAKRPASCSSISFYWSMNRKITELSAHNIFMAEDYKESFDDIFEKLRMPDEPSFYVNVPSRIDPTAAPEGRDSVVVLIPVGHLHDEGSKKGLRSSEDWVELLDRARDFVIKTIERRTGAENLRGAIAAEQVNTPTTWQEHFNLDKGGILGLSIDFWNALAFRPKTKHASISNLYFVGASTHPGTGVPVCLAGAKITTEQILDDLKVEKPWSKATPPNLRAKQRGSSLDIERIESISGMETWQRVLWALVLGSLITFILSKVFG